MHNRMDIHASFGESCPDKHTAENYVRDVVRQVDGVRFEKTIQTRDNPLGFIVQFTIFVDDDETASQNEEEIINELHELATYSNGYENMVIVEGGLYNVEPAD